MSLWSFSDSHLHPTGGVSNYPCLMPQSNPVINLQPEVIFFSLLKLIIPDLSLFHFLTVLYGELNINVCLIWEF